MGVLAGLLGIKSLDEFAERFGSKWAYHLKDIIEPIVLPYYCDMKLAKMDGWDLVNEQNEPWPFPFIEPPAETVGKSHLLAYVRAKELLMRLSGRRSDADGCCKLRFKSKPPLPVSPPLRPVFKSWLEHTANEN